MCGILGVVYADPKHEADHAKLAAARDSLTHRGPDEAGLWHRPGVAMAHRRLKVLDLTHGQQPMVTDDQRYAVVYNGEIYNFRELQEHYQEQGLSFQTQCDTEVLFKALNQDGPDAIERFNGMFAFAHWDDKQRKLTLARDRLGQKPLYWYRDDEQLVYASELEALLMFLERKFPLDPVALDQYFARGYILSPRTIFQGVSKFPAGCSLTLSAAGDTWHAAVEPYGDVQTHAVPDDPEEVLDELEELLRDAVRLRLVSDVPIGCLLPQVRHRIRQPDAYPPVLFNIVDNTNSAAKRQ
jgi:asparagine synthase (glutamine-hydrolysing)